MTRRIAVLIVAAAAAAAAQQQTPEYHYARAYYTKWKPGMRAEGMAFIKGVPSQAARNWLEKQPGAVGQVTMSRVLPGGPEPGPDRLRLVIYSKPPNLDGSDAPGAPAFVEGTGMTPAEYSAKLGSYIENVRSEIWRSVYRHGSFQQGDYVRVTLLKVPSNHFQKAVEYRRTWASAMMAEVVGRGVIRGQETWSTRLPAEEQPSLMNITVYPNSDATYKGFGNQQDVFLKAHPGKDYYTYRQVADADGEAVVSTQATMYRVDLVIWK
ncbi:MAG: hypothetical protein FJW40_18750 [Acidobacteria bacterium]|nr:hypothetical protein [Acidobacteriota bacterium]